MIFLDVFLEIQVSLPREGTFGFMTDAQRQCAWEMDVSSEYFGRLSLINGKVTGAIPIEKGTRQGCPLPPLLFILAIEALAIKIRQDRWIKGIKADDTEFKMKSYADDVVITVSDLRKPLQYVREHIEGFGSFQDTK